jgi:hypothetical protein
MVIHAEAKGPDTARVLAFSEDADTTRITDARGCGVACVRQLTRRWQIR